MTAEWEPAIGVLIGWPLALPYKLVLRMAEDVRLYVLVENRSQVQSAIQSFTKWGLMPDQVKFITADRGEDYFWTRDWGPYGVFVDPGGYRLGDADYSLSTPVTGQGCTDSLEFLYRDDAGKIVFMREEDRANRTVAVTLAHETVSLPFSFTGGNVLCDGQRTAFSTCALANENRYKGKSEQDLRNDVRRYLGIEAFHLISNFETRGIQHIDCFMKLLDEERMLVLRLPADHPDHAQYEGIVEHELKAMKNAYGRPYEILRIDSERYEGDHCAAYTNALILNTTVYVPLFGIPADKVALETWQQAMPGYTVLGFEYVLKNEPDVDPGVAKHYQGIGWTSGDALHCRTRAIWDPEMIYISVDRIPARVSKAKSYPVEVIAKGYGEPGLAGGRMQLKWRVAGDAAWRELPLKPAEWPDHYQARLPGSMAGISIEYYAEVTDAKGKTAVMPRTAPAVPYSFSID